MDVLKYSKKLFDYIKDVKNARKDQQQLVDEINATEFLLKTLDSHANDTDWQETFAKLSEPNGIFDKLKLELSDLEAKKLKPPTGKFDLAKKSLVWLFSETEVKHRIERIERIKSLLQIAAGNDIKFTLFTSSS